MEDFESCLSEVLSKLNETGIAFSLKKEQDSAVRHLLEVIGLHGLRCYRHVAWPSLTPL